MIQEAKETMEGVTSFKMATKFLFCLLVAWYVMMLLPNDLILW